MEIILAIALALLIALFVASFFTRRREYKSEKKNFQASIASYFGFLDSLIIGIGSPETARELCKIKILWDNVSNKNEALSAFELSDGAARLAIAEASEIMDSDAHAELSRAYRFNKNNLLWAILSNIENDERKSIETCSKEAREGLKKAKVALVVRYSHIVKPFKIRMEA